MPPFWEFCMPTRVRFGRGTLRRIGQTTAAFGSRVMLVGYRDRAGLEDVYTKAAEALQAAKLQAIEYFEIAPEPDATTAERGAALARDQGVEAVVGLGGGSVLDAAKGIAALARMDGRAWGFTDANRRSRPVTESLPVLAVPTTAGTGSEVTALAVFEHRTPEDETPLKATLYGPAVAPRAAIVDPDLAVGTPPFVTAACAADALGHAIESCMSRRANPVSTVLAQRAVALIVENLTRSVDEPDDPEPREPLALAATLAGAAFDQAGVTMTHAIAHALGAVLHVPHAVAVAIGTPVNLRYNMEVCSPVYARLARACELAADTEEHLAEAFVERIIDLLRGVGLPDRVEAPADAPPDLAARLAENASASTAAALRFNPRKVDEPSLRVVFEGLLQRVG